MAKQFKPEPGEPPLRLHELEVPIELAYTNYRGETLTRKITPVQLRFNSSEHHPIAQWLLDCYDHDKRAYRTYALKHCCFVLSNESEKHRILDSSD